MKTPGLAKQLGRTLGSLRLTVWLLVFSMMLVFFGTLDQVRIGIRGAQQIYFESFLAIWRYPEMWPLGGVLHHIPLPMPGGYVIGPLLALNLVCSHIRHFRWSWGIVGISIIHAGVLLLLVGQLVTHLFQKDHYLWLDEGASANAVRSFHQDELYLIHYKEGGRAGVHAYDFDTLAVGEERAVEGTPLRLRIRELMQNAEIRSGGGTPGARVATRGLAAEMGLQAREVPPFRSDDQRDTRAAVVEVFNGSESLGTWLVSNVFEDRFAEQTFSVGNERYALGVRYEKTYLPFTVTLLKFTHERYPGTNIPRQFASQVRIDHPEKDEVLETRIYMNHPLRYEGMTFYQASFAKQDTASMFHVVQNPGRHLPYISCLLVTVGLFYQFLRAGIKAMRRKKA